MFLSHVSHELKTPLTSIRGFVDNMTSGLTGDLGEKQRDYLMRIRANTDRLTRMIANLLNVSRIESGVQHLERMPVYLCDAVHECVMQLQLMAESRNIKLETHCPDTDLRVLADPDKLIEIITNLVDNAIKFTPQGGSITIDTRQQEPGKIVVSVTDTGEGIEPEDLDDLFKPFYQAKRTKAHTQGLGLGLSIVKHLVEMHDGSITVASEPGKGSQFRIELPELA
jgi:signal transduction histidine kinase